MKTISISEFRKQINDYLKNGINESIEITKYGKAIFTLVPPIEQAKSYFNMLPREATIGIDLNERD